MSETATLELPSAGPRPMPWLAATFLSLSAVALALLATYGTIRGLHGRHLWMFGAVVAFGFVPAIRLLEPARKLKWLTYAALLLLTVLLFVSGASEGGSFAMWVAGSLTVFGPLLMWVLEPDSDEQPPAVALASAATTESQSAPALQAAA